MKDITNTIRGVRTAAFGGFKELRGSSTSSDWFHQPAACVLDQATAEASEQHETTRQIYSCRESFDGVQLELSRRKGELSATSHGCAGVHCPGASQQLHSSGLDIARGNLFRLHAESREIVGQSCDLGSSLVLQDASERLNTVTRSLELEESRLQDTADLFPLFEKKLGHLEKAVEDLQQERDLLANEVNRLRADAVQHSPCQQPVGPQMPVGQPLVQGCFFTVLHHKVSDPVALRLPPRQIADCGDSSAELMQRVQTLCADLIGTNRACRQGEGSEDEAECDAEPLVPHPAQFYRAVARTFAKQVSSFANDFKTADQFTLLEDLKRFEFWADNQVKPFLQQE